jgi:hypothetical protein
MEDALARSGSNKKDVEIARIEARATIAIAVVRWIGGGFLAYGGTLGLARLIEVLSTGSP